MSNTNEISANEKEFISSALKSDSLRIDGRGLYDFRKLKFQFGAKYGHVEVTLGRTRVAAIISHAVVEPFPDRPTEGFLSFNVVLSPMADPSFDAKTSEQSIEIGRVVDRALRGSRAIDTEALCIVAGHKVWNIRVDLHMLDNYGNILDCTHIAAVTALLHFRRPEITVSGEDVIIHSIEEREPVPLSIHHIPICTTFAFFHRGDVVIVDPALKEEQVLEGVMTMALNVHGEVCTVQKGGGIPITVSQILKCTGIASVKAQEITRMIKRSIDADAKERRIQRMPSYAKQGLKEQLKEEKERMKEGRDIGRTGDDAADEIQEKNGDEDEDNIEVEDDSDSDNDSDSDSEELSDLSESDAHDEDEDDTDDARGMPVSLNAGKAGRTNEESSSESEDSSEADEDTASPPPARRPRVVARRRKGKR